MHTLLGETLPSCLGGAHCPLKPSHPDPHPTISGIKVTWNKVIIHNILWKQSRTVINLELYKKPLKNIGQVRRNLAFKDLRKNSQGSTQDR